MSYQDAVERPPGWEDADRGPSLLAYTIVMNIVVVLAVVGRFWSRFLKSAPTREKRFWWDDWMVLASLPFVLTLFACEYYMIGIGFGRHNDTLPPVNARRIIQLSYANHIIFSISLFFGRASAIFFLSRVFPRCASPTWFNTAVVVTHGLNCAWIVAIGLAYTFRCLPIHSNWDHTVEGRCLEQNAVCIGNAVTAVFIDLVILVLPLPNIWMLSMRLQRKIAITFIFALGYGVVVISLARMIINITMTPEQVRDGSWGYVPLMYTVNIETPVLLMGVCLPAMLPLGRYFKAHLWSPLASRWSFLRSSGSVRALGGRSELRSREKTTMQSVFTAGEPTRMSGDSSHEMLTKQTTHRSSIDAE